MELDFIVETLNSTEIVENGKFNILYQEMVDFCKHKHMLACHRELSRIRLELSYLLDETDFGKRKIIEKMICLIEEELTIVKCKMEHPELTEEIAEKEGTPRKQRQWTASVSDLVELIYFIHQCTGIDVKEIAERFEYMMQVNLDNRYKIIGQIAARKKNKTKFIAGGGFSGD